MLTKNKFFLFLSFGFTLLELLIVLAIIAILSLLAYPSYSHYETNAQRNRAEVVLMQLAARLEIYASDHEGSYGDATVEDLNVAGLSQGLSYQFVISKISDDHFTLAAIPLNSQAKNDARCGVLTLTDANIRNAAGEGGAVYCWQ